MSEKSILVNLSLQRKQNLRIYTYKEALFSATGIVQKNLFLQKLIWIRSKKLIITGPSQHQQIHPMVIITLQRKKCIGCNYCVELAPKQFQMSKKDGKSVLLHSNDKKGFFTIKSPDMTILEDAVKAKEACPVNIISVKEK